MKFFGNAVTMPKQTNADRIRAMSDEELEKIADFLMALSNAQDNGQKEFTCPLCGGTVKMVRAPGNGHIHAACAGCGTKVCE